MPSNLERSPSTVPVETAPEPLVCELCRSIHGSQANAAEDHCADWCQHDATN